MSRYFYEVHGQMFEIHVCAAGGADDAVLPFFVACTSRIDGCRLVPVTNALGRREVYGPTEAWAVRNARDLLTARVRDTTRPDTTAKRTSPGSSRT